MNGASLAPDDIPEKLRALKGEIAEAADRCGRKKEDVRLLAVSKGQSTEKIQAAYAAGHRDFGENYAQELKAKMEALSPACPNIRWHFIGRIQSNKAGVIARTHLVHSVASIEHALALARRRENVAAQKSAGTGDSGEALPILLQVNLVGEEAKGGFAPNALRKTIEALSAEKTLKVQGLMAIPPLETSAADAARFFEGVARLRDGLEAGLNLDLPELSMGMSQDFPAAIAQGATWVRVGTAIFGPRQGGHGSKKQ
jgi:pyridoxal phosphate enzyme (YggS family)